MSDCLISKSIKRRRFLEELEVNLDESDFQLHNTSMSNVYHTISSSNIFKPVTTPSTTKTNTIYNKVGNDEINDGQLPII